MKTTVLDFVQKQLGLSTTSNSIISNQFIQVITPYDNSADLRDDLEELYRSWKEVGIVKERIDTLDDEMDCSFTDIYFKPEIFADNGFTSLRIIDNQRRFSPVEYLIGTGL